MKFIRLCILSIACVICFVPPIAAQSDDNIAHRCLIIPVQFADTCFTYSIDQISEKVDATADYFNSQFNGKRSFSFDIAPVVTLPGSAAFYGDNNIYNRDRKVGVMVYEACQMSDNDVDFSAYDSDSDGIVDRVFLICAGGNEAEDGISTSFWSQNWNLQEACHESQDYDKEYLTLDGKRISSFAVTSEFKHDASSYKLMGMGMLCHEFGHFLGLMDMYDTDGELSGGLSVGLWGNTSLMDKGNFNGDSDCPPYFNAIELDMLGLGVADTLHEGLNTLKPIGDSQTYFKCSVPDGSCYYIECRRSRGRDKYCGGNGMLIYLVDKTERDAGFSAGQGRNLTAAERWSPINEVNCRPDRQCALIKPAAAQPVQIAEIFYPYGEVRSFGPVGSWLLSGISLNPDGSVSFQANSIYLDGFNADCYQDAAILSWHSSIGTDFSLHLGGELIASGLKPYGDGLYSYTLEGLEPSREYEVSLSPELGQKASFKFKTRPYYVSVPPFIELRSVKRNPDGSFAVGVGLPLRISSCRNMDSAEWSLDKTGISVGPDGYCHIYRGGTLKAVIRTADGNTITIIKDISVK